jgi:lysophospholipase L1-like esterase
LSALFFKASTRFVDQALRIRQILITLIIGSVSFCSSGNVEMKLIKTLHFVSLLVLILAVSLQAQTTENRFEKQVQAYEAADKATPPPKNAILLVGDSQFFRWKTLAEDLPDFTIINRGIDSFQFSDILHFYDRLVLPYKPRMIVLHVGGNDVHNGKSSERVREDFKTFVAKVRATQPNIPIVFSSLTPGPGRWDEADKRRQTNKLLKDYISTQKNLHFIDLWDAMLTKEGQPREDLWVADRIHPNHQGYLVRVKIMRPLLGKPDHKAK